VGKLIQLVKPALRNNAPLSYVVPNSASAESGSYLSRKLPGSRRENAAEMQTWRNTRLILILFPRNPQLLHSGLQSSSLHSQARSRAAHTGYHSSSFP